MTWTSPQRRPWFPARPTIVRVESGAVARALHPGSTTLSASLGERHLEIPVTVAPASPEPPGFVRDVLPVLSKSGCNAGACHAKPDGQNGFHLTVFSYDPQSDYDEIVKHARGRRVFPSSPAESLILLKATLTVPHEGGERFDKDSDAYKTITDWIAGGMVFRAEHEPSLERLTVFPNERRYHKGDSPAPARARALLRWIRCAMLPHSPASSRMIRKSPASRKTASSPSGKVSGEAVIVARFMGLVGDARIIVPADRLLPESQYAGLPVNNFIDELA